MDTTNDLTQDALRDEIRREVRDEVRKEARADRRRHCLGCLTVYLIILGSPTVFGLITVAKSGIYDIPVLTGWLYKPFSPTREVRPLMGSDANVVWRQAAAGMEYDIRTGNGIIRFTEADLTTVIDESLSVAAADLPLSVKNPQIAVLPDSMEFAFTTPRGDRNVPVIVQMSPHVKGGLLTLEVLGITVGGTKLPGFLTDMAAKMINKVFVQDFSSNLPDGVLLRKVETTRDGHLNLTIGLSG